MEKIKHWHLTAGAETDIKEDAGLPAVLRLVWIGSLAQVRGGQSHHRVHPPPPLTHRRRHADGRHMFGEVDAAITPPFRPSCLLDSRRAATFDAIWKHVPASASAALPVGRLGFNL